VLAEAGIAVARTDFKSVDDYIAAQPQTARETLERVRDAIRKAVPRAEEVVSYKIPAYKLPGGIALYFAGWKQHYSLYPVSDHVVAAFRGELAPYTVNKATVRFPLSEPVPVKLIGRIAKFRAAELAGRSKPKAPKAKAKQPSSKKR
jgi:uncharacterized protein YdhG (YjbR/CyaY superfamily)